ncbi:MAG TPA: T9SS C-terminal target domain-containing protein [Cyclobacteriaceae bacterium]|nr:T9SS C-terminal target domain-containing protein [Cyclobacteriaceae bacterium]
MKKIRFTLLMITTTVLSLSLFTLSSCDETKDPTYAEPTISADIKSATPGAVEILVAVTAPAGLKTVEVGDDSKSYTSDQTSDIYTYTYTGTASSLTFLVTDVKDRQAETTVALEPFEIVSADITTNTSWSKDTKYLLKGNIFVNNNAELTIEAGTIIYGDKVSKGALIIERGSKIIAEGTATSPIVFTSSAPAGFRNYGDWGGLIILGKATNNQGENVNIEGITAGTKGQYGGTADDDNSGTLAYVRVEFAGIALSTDNEINGMTFGSVGSGTTMHHVQVSYSGDDAYEFFGGKVSPHHMIAYKTWDDDFDTDFGFSGKVQFAAAFRDPNVADKSGSNLFESDNDGSGSTNQPYTSAIFANVTAFGPFVFANLSGGALSNGAVSANYQNGAHVRRHSKLQIWNSVIVGAGTSANWPFRLTDSKGGADAAAVFKGNYVGRSVSASVTAPATGTNDNGYNVDNFGTDNIIESPLNKVDLSTLFAGLSGAANIDNPAATAVLANGSALATGATDLSGEGFTQTDYIGAVGTTAGWLDEAWVNFNPQGTDY